MQPATLQSTTYSYPDVKNNAQSDIREPISNHTNVSINHGIVEHLQ